MKKMAQIRALMTVGVVWAAFLPLSACLQQGKAKTPTQQENIANQNCVPIARKLPCLIRQPSIMFMKAAVRVMQRGFYIKS